MYLLGFDIGSSSVKASLIEVETGVRVATANSPAREMDIIARRPDWAEQDPEVWWEHVCKASRKVRRYARIKPGDIAAIGIAYQMHGLVVIDKAQRPLRPAIIWCDSRAVAIGEQAFKDIGPATCQACLLNSPGNFTASKLKWVREHEPEVFAQIDKMLLPGDYIALKMTGEICTTPSGLSEAMLWDYRQQRTADFVLDYYGIPVSVVPDVVPTFSSQGTLTPRAARELGLAPGIPVAYRAGDQPNNAFALGVRQPGEVAATAGTSGVVYGIQDTPRPDHLSRVNIFLHVNHSPSLPRYGVLLCVNGAGILNRWVKEQLAGRSYDDMLALAGQAPVGSQGLLFLPYGNGAERTLNDREIGAGLCRLNLKVHGLAHVIRAAQEGVAFAMCYGLEIMRAMGIKADIIRAGHTNMFLSPIFAATFANVAGCSIELFDTDGAQGAARGAGIGAGIYADQNQAVAALARIRTIEPDPAQRAIYHEAYAGWHALLNTFLQER